MGLAGGKSNLREKKSCHGSGDKWESAGMAVTLMSISIPRLLSFD